MRRGKNCLTPPKIDITSPRYRKPGVAYKDKETRRSRILKPKGDQKMKKVYALFASSVAICAAALTLTSCGLCCWDNCCNSCCEPVCVPRSCPHAGCHCDPCECSPCCQQQCSCCPQPDWCGEQPWDYCDPTAYRLRY